MTIKQLLRLSIILAIVSLATPFIWIKIGPAGYAFYGPEVPDIYILGATILGKDRSFWGIAIASALQLIGILFFISSNYLIFRKISKKRVLLFSTFNFILLVLFPFWLKKYVDGVVNNSDGAASDLTIYPHIGLLVYGLLLIFSVAIIIKALRMTSGMNNISEKGGFAD
jgi:hypothetical protein